MPCASSTLLPAVRMVPRAPRASWCCGARIFGTATTGGLHGSGIVFQLTPAQSGEWDFKTLYSFQGAPDGVFPYGAVLFDAAGNIYGTTYYGGTHGLGVVYQLSPTTSGEWSETVLHSFRPRNDGHSSISNLVFDAAGNLYGTTSEGGLGSGTIFKLAPGPNGPGPRALRTVSRTHRTEPFPTPEWWKMARGVSSAPPCTAAKMAKARSTSLLPRR